MAKKTVLELTFLSGGKALQRVTADQIDAPIEIGVSASAHWRPSDDDLTMRERHATISVSGEAVKIQPVAGAPLTRNARPFAGGRLAAGDRIAVGDSEITVRSVAYVPKSSETTHRLEGLNGPYKGRIRSLDGETLLVGSDPAGGLVLEGDIISAQHAELRVDEQGSVWIRDLGSRNGTFVNGERLTNVPRMIQDSDVIGFAIWDFRFLDRAVLHTRTRLGPQLLAAGIAALCCVGAYLGFVAMSPLTRDILAEKDLLCQQGRLEEAWAVLEKAGDCRDADRYRDLVASGRRRLMSYLRVWRQWTAFTEALQRGAGEDPDSFVDDDWTESLDLMGSLDLNNTLAWSWQPETLDERLAEARTAKELLSFTCRLRNILTGYSATREDFAKAKSRLAELGVTKESWLEDRREWLVPLKRSIRSQALALEQCVGRVLEIDALVEGCGTKLSDLERVSAKLDAIERESIGFVRSFAEGMGDPVNDQIACSRLIASNCDCIVNLRPEAINRQLEFPSVDECLVHPRIGQIRSHYLSRNQQVRLAAGRLRAVLRMLDQNGLAGEDAPELAVFADRDLWRRVFACSVYAQPLPPHRRQAPVDEYDRVLGIEWLCSYIKQAPLAYPSQVAYADVSGPEFVPTIVRVRELIGMLRSADALLKSKDFQEFNLGRVAELRRRIDGMLARAAACADFMAQIMSEEGESRTALLAAAVRSMLMPADAVTEADMKQLRDLAQVRRRKLDAVIAGVDAFDEAALAKKADEILREAIPGDARGMKAWAAKSGGGGRK